MESTVLFWVLSVALILAGLAGTVLPVLPGTVVVVSVLGLLAWVLDYAAGLLGARKAGASRLALPGAAVGTVAGLFMPLVGAAVGEYLAQKDHGRAARVDMATWVGIMVGIFCAALLI